MSYTRCDWNQNLVTYDASAADVGDDDWNDDDSDDNLQWSYERMIYELQDKHTLLLLLYHHK